MNEFYRKQILLNFPMQFRPIVSQILDLTEEFLLINDNLNYLRALIVGEPTDVVSIENSYFNMAYRKVSRKYRNDFFYLIAKAKEFMIHSKFIPYLKALHLANIKIV